MNVGTLQSLTGTVSTKIVGNNSVVQSDTTSPQTNATKDVSSSDLSYLGGMYDVTHLSLQQIPELNNDLYTRGLISGGEAAALCALPHMIENGDLGDSIRLSSDGTVDLLNYWKDLMSSQRTSNTSNSVQTLEELASLSKSKSGASKFASATQNTMNTHGAITSYIDSIHESTLDTDHITKILEAIASYPQDKSGTGML